jgi:broad specificity phosphatase PhoE
MSLADASVLQTRLLLLCRGPVDWARGSDGDPPLTSEGVRDVELAAASLPHLDVIAASPQRSSQETADAVLPQRPTTVVWHDGLDEIRPSGVAADAGAYGEWLDRLFMTYGSSESGESLADGATRLTSALRGIADRYYGRTALVVSHPVILLAFRGTIMHKEVQRDQIDALPAPALSVLDYVEGRFYLIQDFPTRQPT